MKLSTRRREPPQTTLLPESRAALALLHSSAAILHVKELTANIDELDSWTVASLDDERSTDHVVLSEVFSEKLRVRLVDLVKEFAMCARSTCTL